ncbi:MAG: hypothetical protein OXG53_17105 [Chloroflexi bacterium]|nr:hypothetical protein [Chloroflexota bacterium]
MKWHQRPATNLILRTTKYTMLCLTLYLFVHEMAFFVSHEAAFSYENTVGDYLRESIKVLIATAIFVTMIGGPLGLVLGSVAAGALAPGFRGPTSVRLVLGFIASLALIPVIHHFPGFILALDGDKARLIGLLAIIPMALALRWSQIMAGMYISEKAQDATSEQTMHQHNLMVLRTSAYSVAVGVPLMTTYVWLYVTVARTWIYNDPFILLLICLILGSIGFAFLGGIVGAFLVIVSNYAYERIQDGARFRILVSLVPLLVIALLLLPTPPGTLERFWWKLQFGNSLAKLDAAGWLLAAATAVGICQIVAAKYLREVSPPKNDGPTLMWRPIPLMTAVAAIVVCGLVISIVDFALYLALVEPAPDSRLSDFENLMRAGRDGVSVGLIYGSVIALTIMLRFSEIRRIRVFRLTIVCVTFIVALLIWGRSIQHAFSQLAQEPGQVWAGHLLAKVSLLVVTSIVMADIYRRAVPAPVPKHSASEDKLKFD